MKLLLVLEHRFFATPGNEIVYCERNIDYSFFKRYLKVFDELIVCARTVDVDKNYQGSLIASGQNVKFLKLPNIRGWREIAKKNIEYKKIVKKYIQEIDAVILRAPTPISLAVFDVIKKSKKALAVEFVINPRTLFSNENGKNITNKLLQYLFVKHAKEMCWYANGVSYVTDHILQKEYPCKAIKNGESEKYFTASYSTIDLPLDKYTGLHEFHTKDEPVIICHTGYMEGDSKGHKIAMDVVKKGIEEGLNIRLKFLGTGSKESEFKKYAQFLKIEEYVIFMGQLYGYEAIQKELINSDIFLFPTSAEGLPRSLIEAMANGLACISTPVDGIKELLPEKYLVMRKDINRMVKILSGLVNNVEERRSAAEENYNVALRYEYTLLDERRTAFYSQLYSLANKIKRV